MILISAMAGTLAGIVMLLLSHLAPIVGAGNFVKDIDTPRVFGKEISRREATIIGALVHVLISAVFGGMYAHLVQQGFIAGFHLWNMLGWSVIMTIFVGGVVMPLEGHGIFGTKEDAWFPVDLILTNTIWAILFWWLIRLWSTLIAQP
jgi:hypothetical protein